MALLTKWRFPAISEFLESTDLMTPFFSNEMKFNMPAANVMEKDNEFQISLAVPGMSKDDFKIMVENHNLVVSVEKESENKEEKKDYTRMEYDYTSFNRSFWLPEIVKEEDIKADYKDGVLKIRVPKKEIAVKKAVKSIKVQ
jgi:HSP20 family protein